MHLDNLNVSKWVTDLALDWLLGRGTRHICGTCAFKTPPASNEVEIAYFTCPENEGRGVATAMAQSLVDIATKNGVGRIKAQTLPEKNASTRILEKLGFRFSCQVMHPEDSEVWEWVKLGSAQLQR